MAIKCGFCGVKMSKGIRGYPQREQLHRHLEVDHPVQYGYHKFLRAQQSTLPPTPCIEMAVQLERETA